jgi:hypothetical protein
MRPEPFVPDLKHYDVDLDPSFHFDANPDTFHFVADPDPDPARNTII